MTRKKALDLVSQAVAYTIQQKHAFAAALYDTGAAKDDWAKRHAQKRDALLEALETLEKPERILL